MKETETPTQAIRETLAEVETENVFSLSEIQLGPLLFTLQRILDESWRAYFYAEESYKVAEAGLRLTLWDKDKRPDLKNDTQRNAELALWKYRGDSPENYPDPALRELVGILPDLREEKYRLKSLVNEVLFHLDRVSNAFTIRAGYPPAHVAREGGRG